MARATQDAIETFISITGASEAVALQKLEDILKSADAIKEDSIFIPGNGVETKFWKDPWLRGASPASICPNLIWVAYNVDDLICDSFTCVVNSIIWCPRLRRNLNDVEAMEFTNLVDLLQGVELKPEDEDVVCRRSKQGGNNLYNNGGFLKLDCKRRAYRHSFQPLLRME
ncbi:hypothetical protein QJS04_geneDACA000945 [Acorus gramineus]|uniref:Uncharacterized protein n=1 Tax=Acorus gramineus TaxID=55184 RepID=A0AAV9ADH7_ACOGR|nr:hypothetical protein QJS04_geneDACA000945 [Acorus gramineus]